MDPIDSSELSRETRMRVLVSTILLVWFGNRLSTLVGGIPLMENDRLPKLKGLMT